MVVSPNTVDFQPKLDEFEAKIIPKTRAVTLIILITRQVLYIQRIL